jgi:hypothetical protein
MITPMVRLAQVVEDTKRAHAEIEPEKLLGHLNRFNQSKSIAVRGPSRTVRGSSCEAPSENQCKQDSISGWEAALSRFFQRNLIHFLMDKTY